MKKKINDAQSDQDEFDADEPSEVEELQNDASDDEWTPKAEPQAGRRLSSRAKNPSKRVLSANSSSEEQSEGEETKKKKVAKTQNRGKGKGGKAAAGGGGAAKGRGGGKTKAKEVVKQQEEEEEDEDEEEPDETSSESDCADTPIEFRSGSFVVLKTDFVTGGEHPIWKIDGKSLLQKYVHQKVEDGESIYKGTTIYAGWSKTSNESYYPITVYTKKQKGKDHFVTFNKKEVKVDGKED